ncbi:MAG TPA: vWA domain-containing protein, partial [Saprospiraceae bacterium]
MYNKKTQRYYMFSRFTSFLFFCFALFSSAIQAQTDFAPGQIMFTGYNSDDPDGFSFVILTDVVDGTVIYITDRGWSGTTGFRDDTDGGEGTISFEFTADYPCGTTFILQDIGTAPNVWVATDEYGVVTGIVTILINTTESTGQDPQGIELNAVIFPANDGDQLFIYQLPEPNPANQTGFVTGIHMNGGAWNSGNGDDYSSMQPTGLANNQVVRFNTEVDNAKYDCTPVTGTSSALQAAIENDNGVGGLILDGSNNWFENNSFQALLPACHFCCGSTAPAPAPTINAPPSAFTNQVFTILIDGTLAGGASWELYSAGCGVGAPLQTTTTSSFNIMAPSTAGVYTYYVRSSEAIDCEAICATFQISVCASTNMNTCTNCTANPASCGDCWLPPPTDNPDLDSGCYEIKLIFILDESGSIGSDEINVRNGVLAFLNSLNGQDILVALIEFSDLARVVNDYTVVNTTYIQNVQNYFDNIPFPGSGQIYQPGGGTNWHDAMIKADAMPVSDMIMFFTDGIPTAWTNNGGTDYCSNGSTTQTPEIVNPVKLANKFKGEDTHMFMLGVGSGIDAENLSYMSGLAQYEEGVN